MLSRLEPDAETLWEEARTQIDLQSGILVLDDSTLENPYSEFNALVYRHWSGKQKAVVSAFCARIRTTSSYNQMTAVTLQVKLKTVEIG